MLKNSFMCVVRVLKGKTPSAWMEMGMRSKVIFVPSR